MFLTWCFCFCSLLWAQEEVVAPDSTVMTAQDSLAVLLAEPPLDSLIFAYADSLFLPQSGRARIVRDDYGVPHIYGATDADVAFGFGFAQAEDHLIEMLLSYRMAKGEASEILGPAFIETDFKSRLWRIDHAAGEQYGALSEGTRSVIGAFVDGVNHYIEIKAQGLPSWVRPIRGTDVIASTRWTMLLFAEASGRSELAAKGIRPTLDRFGANQMVIAPNRTLSSAGLSISDVHLPWDLPFKLYEGHLKSREGLDVSGATFFGWPMIFIGHNDRLAWSLTPNDADIFDLFEEQLDVANNKRYLFEREKQRISVRREKIRVNSGVGVSEVVRELQYSHHGPIYKVVDNWAYAARTSADDVTDVIGQLYQMNRATDIQTFRLALSHLAIPVFNVAYGDVDGNLYYAFLSRTPIRATKFDWRSPVPGWTKETNWGGILPFSQLPQVINPEASFLQNCNTPPDAVTLSSSLEPTNFPPYLGWGKMNDRGRRALVWLSSNPLVSVDDALAFSRDEYLLSAESLKGFVLRAYNKGWKELYDPKSQLALAISVLRGWDNRASVDSRATLLFATWKERFDGLYGQLGAEQRKDLVVLERLALEALQGAVAYMNTTFGRVDVRWGEVHRAQRGELSAPVGGAPPGTEALHQLWSTGQEDGTHVIGGGSAYTSVVELTSPPRAWSALPYGNSEDSTSVHYADQLSLQTQNRLKRNWVADADVAANLTRISTVPYEGEALETEKLRAWWAYRRKLSAVKTDSVATEPTGVIPE
jgi:acyl-homoserine lactone acylase PvdQ